VSANNFNINVPSPNIAITSTAGAAGISTVSANNFNINVPVPNIAVTNTSTAVGISTVSANNFNINVPSANIAVTSTVGAAGISTVSANNYNINIPPATVPPNIAVTSTTGAAGISTVSANNFNINVPPAVSPNIAVTNTSTAVGISTVSANNFNINVPSANIAVTSTAGAVAISTTSANNFNINIPAPNIAVTSTAGAVGISTTSANNFNINIPPAANTWSLGGNAGTNPVTNYIGTSDAQDLALRSNGIERMRVSSAGLVGIGTTTATEHFEVESSGSTQVSIISNAAGTANLYFGRPNFHFRGNVRYDNSTDAMDFWTGNSSRMIISGTGNVGIGTSAPNAPLQFANTIPSFRKIVLYEQANNDHQILGIGLTSANELRYQVNAATSSHVFYGGITSSSSREVMRIMGGGNVGIGYSAPSTTFVIGNGLAEKVTINGSQGDMTFNDDQASIQFPVPTASAAPLIYLQPTGTASPDRMVISHSPSYTNYGLQYQDLNDRFVFLGSGQPVLTADLGGYNVGVGTASPGINPSGGGTTRYLTLSSATAYINAPMALEIEGSYAGINVPHAKIDFNTIGPGPASYNVARIGSQNGNSIGQGNLVFSTRDGTNLFERMRIDKDGNVGIGTNAPDYRLTVYGAAASATNGPNMSFVTSADIYPTMHILNWGHSEQYLMFNAYYDGFFRSSGTVGNHEIGFYNGKLVFRTTSGNAAGANINSTWIDAMMIRNNGYVGIGIDQSSQPNYLFHVNKDDSGILAYFDNNSKGSGTGLRSEVVTTATTTGIRYGLEANGSYGMSSGYGVSANGWYNTASNFGVYGYGYGGTTSYGIYGFASGASGNNYAVYCSGSGGFTGSWTNVSDRRFKENISPLTGALDKIMLLQPKTYTLKRSEYDYMNFPAGTQIGLIAQEVAEVIPELVEDATNPGPLDPETRRPKGEEIKYKAMNYIALTPVLVQAIKEQQAQIEDLKKKLEDQQKLIDALMKK
jgi:hypothetical protein